MHSAGCFIVNCAIGPLAITRVPPFRRSASNSERVGTLDRASRFAQVPFTRATVQAWRAALEAKGLAPASVNQKLETRTKRGLKPICCPAGVAHC